MDKQTNIQIPVNTRTIGTPEGIYILYLEDYVHTFIKKILASQTTKNNTIKTNELHGIKETQDDIYSKSLNVEEKQTDIVLYGKNIEKNGRCSMIISGAAVINNGTDGIKYANENYFPSCNYIASAHVSHNKDNGLRIELLIGSTKVIADDFYIYYDQNEEMQNYLVQWNEKDNVNNILNSASDTEKSRYERTQADSAVKLGRIAQAYNREEAKVSFMWNVMNVLCLGFVVCVMAYGIISINNYSKMQSMQSNIDYLMTLAQSSLSGQTLPVMQPNANNAADNIINETETQTEAQTEIENKIESETESKIENKTESETEIITENQTEIKEQSEAVSTEVLQAETNQQLVSEAPQTDESRISAGQSTPQYYVVRKGDTLRTICYTVYGDYSHVNEICEWNNITNPDNILYGQKLLLP